MQWNLVTHRKISLNQHSVHTNTTHNNMDPISDWFFFVAPCAVHCMFSPPVSVSVVFVGSRAYRYFHCIVCAFLCSTTFTSAFSVLQPWLLYCYYCRLSSFAVFFLYSSLRRVKSPCIYIYVPFILSESENFPQLPFLG